MRLALSGSLDLKRTRSHRPANCRQGGAVFANSLGGSGGHCRAAKNLGAYHLSLRSGAIGETDTKNPGKPFPARGPELLASAVRFMTGGVS